MVNPRPSPKQIAALKFEIAQRYKRNAKEARKRNRSRGMAAIRLSELTRWLDDAYGAGVELEATDHSYLIVRIFAHHLGALPDTARRITVWAATYASWIKPRDLERLITEVTDCPIKWTADKLAWKIRLDDATRTRLKIRTVGAIDCNREQRELRRKAKRKERDAARYRAKRRSPNISI